MSIKNIIFDFDHTLVELGPHVEWRRAIQHIEAIYLEEGIPLAIVEQSRGHGFWLMRTVYDYMLGSLSSERTREIQGRVFSALENYELAGAERASPMEGAEGLLLWLSSNAYRCAIVSSNGNRAIESVLENHSLRRFFDGVFGRNPSCRLKPYPDQNGACLKSLGWRAEDTLLVGDSPDDVLSAKPLAIGTIGVITGLGKRTQLLEAGADRAISNLNEVPSVLESRQLK